MADEVGLVAKISPEVDKRDAEDASSTIEDAVDRSNIGSTVAGKVKSGVERVLQEEIPFYDTIKKKLPMPGGDYPGGGPPGGSGGGSAGLDSSELVDLAQRRNEMLEIQGENIADLLDIFEDKERNNLLGFGGGGDDGGGGSGGPTGLMGLARGLGGGTATTVGLGLATVGAGIFGGRKALGSGMFGEAGKKAFQRRKDMTGLSAIDEFQENPLQAMEKSMWNAIDPSGMGEMMGRKAAKQLPSPEEIMPENLPELQVPGMDAIPSLKLPGETEVPKLNLPGEEMIPDLGIPNDIPDLGIEVPSAIKKFLGMNQQSYSQEGRTEGNNPNVPAKYRNDAQDSKNNGPAQVNVDAPIDLDPDRVAQQVAEEVNQQVNRAMEDFRNNIVSQGRRFLR